MNQPTDSDRVTWPQVLETLLDGESLTDSQTRWAMTEVMGGTATPAQIAAFLVALRGRGVEDAQLAALVEVMLDHAVTVDVAGTTVDTCGTGGDNSGSVNISTMAAVVVAASGRPVVKHGNRAASSQSGSADVLEAMGVVIDLSPELIADSVAQSGIAFCFAPVFHPAMRHAGPVRKELGIRSVFNFLGPLANPARPAAQVVGVSDPAMAPVVAAALARRGTCALVVRGEDGMDEITTLAPTRVWDARGASVAATTLDTTELGIARPATDALRGGSAADNAAVARAVLGGATEGAAARAVLDAVAVNAAAAMVVHDTAAGLVSAEVPLVTALKPCVDEAIALMQTGAAGATLDRWVDVTRTLAGRPAVGS